MAKLKETKKFVISLILFIVILVVIIGLIMAAQINNNEKYKSANKNANNYANEYKSTAVYLSVKDKISNLMKNFKKQNINLADGEAYYCIDTNLLVIRGYIGTKQKYVEVTSNSVTIFDEDDTIAFGAYTVKEHYGNGFVQAKKDTQNKAYIYFKSLTDIDT